MKVLFRLTAVIFLTSAAFGAEKLTLEDALNLGLKSNISVLKEEQNVFIAKQQVRESRLLFLPSVVFSADYAKGELEAPLALNRENVFKYLDLNYDKKDYYALSAFVALPVYTGGRQRKALELSKVNYSKSRAILESESKKIASEVKKAFYKALYCEKILNELSKTYPRIEVLFDQVAKNSVDYFEAFKIKYEMDLAQKEAQREREKSLKELKLLISKINDFELEGDFNYSCQTPCQPERVALAAVENSAELKKNIYQAGIDALSVEMAFRRKYPDIFLGYAKTVSASSLSDLSKNESLQSQAFFLSLNLPINYDFWTQIQKKKAQERVGELEMIALKEELKEKAESSCLDYNYFCSRLKETEKQISQMQELIDSSKQSPLSEMKKIKILCEVKKNYYFEIYKQKEKAFELENFIKK